MAADEVFTRLRDALKTAITGSKNEPILTESSTMAGSTVIKQLLVEFRGGNEYLRLDFLLDPLRSIGNLTVFEFHGQAGGEPCRIVADIQVTQQQYQVIIHFS